MRLDPVAQWLPPLCWRRWPDDSKNQTASTAPPGKFPVLFDSAEPDLGDRRRVLLAVGLLLLVTLITYIGREGYTDSQGDSR